MADIEKIESSEEIGQKRSVSGNAFVNDIRHIIENGLKNAYQSVSTTMVHTYWQIGQRIVEEEQHGEKRAEYGTRLLDFLAEELSNEYATGFSARNLRDYRQFYLYFNDLEIWHSRVPNLSWTHFRMMLRVADEDARYWYLRAADVIKNWLRNRYTVEFLGIWEKVHNPNFNSVEFDIIKSQAGLHNSLSMKVYRNKSACTNSTRLPFSK